MAHQLPHSPHLPKSIEKQSLRAFVYRRPASNRVRDCHPPHRRLTPQLFEVARGNLSIEIASYPVRAPNGHFRQVVGRFS